VWCQFLKSDLELPSFGENTFTPLLCDEETVQSTILVGLSGKHEIEA